MGEKASNSIQYPFSFSFSWFLNRTQSRFQFFSIFFFFSSSLLLFFLSFLADNSNLILIKYIIRKAAYLLLILLLLFTVLHMRIGILRFGFVGRTLSYSTIFDSQIATWIRLLTIMCSRANAHSLLQSGKETNNSIKTLS